MVTVVRTTQSEETLTTTISQEPSSPSVVLKLRKPQSDQKVRWTEETIDNEHMGKKSSKCCCIYEKPRIFGEDSSSDDNSSDSDDNAYEKKTKKERAQKKRSKQHDCNDHDHSQHSSDLPGPPT
ncbi:E3 ubiquitin-protein ligase PPP1R11-like [Styela clava]